MMADFFCEDYLYMCAVHLVYDLVRQSAGQATNDLYSLITSSRYNQ